MAINTNKKYIFLIPSIKRENQILNYRTVYIFIELHFLNNFRHNNIILKTKKIYNSILKKKKMYINIKERNFKVIHQIKQNYSDRFLFKNKKKKRE